MKRTLVSIALALLAGWLQAAENVRPAAVAGSWYSANPENLGRYLDGLLDAAKPGDKPGRVRALITPHAGYRYSGSAAADGFNLIRGDSFKRVIVLGPAHRGYFKGLSIAGVTHYETPLGRIPLDRAAVARLRESDLVSADPVAHDREHSIEMQLPLLQRSLKPGWRLLPVLVGDMAGDDYRKAADLLRPLLQEDTLIVVSSDFTHYGPRFGYTPFPQDENTAAGIDKLDKGALQKILAKDADAFVDYQRETGITVCGYRPIAILLHLLPDALEVRLRSYATSGEMTGDYRHSVSYMTIAFQESGKENVGESIYNEENLKKLHELASSAVDAAVHPRNLAAQRHLNQLLDGIPETLRQPSGAFVTLKKHGKLRGCIGYIKPIKPLHRAIADNGQNAAVHDYRFRPVRDRELADLEVEVSVLTPPRPIATLDEFRLGEQGIILKKDGRSAVFLPEVATEQGWDTEQTLTHLSRKAGLGGDGWKEGAGFEVFESIKYSAPYIQSRK